MKIEDFAVSVAVLAILLVLASLTFAEPQYTLTLTNAVNKVAPLRPIKNGKDFTAYAAVAQGSYIENSSGKIYCALTSGTNGTSEPSHGMGTNSSGSVVYYRVRDEKRKGLVIANTGTTTIWWAAGYPGEEGAPGAPLTTNGVVTFDEKLQMEIYAGTNGVISVQEL